MRILVKGKGCTLGRYDQAWPSHICNIQNLWGIESVTIRELHQLCVGNALLGFAIMAFLEVIFADGIGLIEHPAEPEDDPSATSIWRLPLIQALMAFPRVE